jgi:hypothetical protein
LSYLDLAEFAFYGALFTTFFARGFLTTRWSLAARWGWRRLLPVNGSPYFLHNVREFLDCPAEAFNICSL